MITLLKICKKKLLNQSLKVVFEKVLKLWG